MNYPVPFSSKTETTSGIQTTWKCTSGPNNTELAIPPEFAGPGGGLSPEDLFNQALTNCFVATFKVYAEHSKLKYEKILVDSELLVDLDENKKPVMKSLRAQVSITGCDNIDRAKLLADKAARSGFILNSVKTICNFEFNIS